MSSSSCPGIVFGAVAFVVGSIIAPLGVSSAAASTFIAATIPIVSKTIADPTPVAVAIDPGTHRAYVANSADSTVSVVDTDANQVIATVPHLPTSIGNSPSDVAVDSVHSQVYVTNFFSHTVSVIDTTTNLVTKVIPHDPTLGIGQQPAAVAVDSELSRAFVTNQLDGTVSVIDTAANAVVGVIPHDASTGIGTLVSDIEIDTGLHRAYVANSADDTVSVVDTRSNAVITVIQHDAMNGIGKKPRQIAVDEVTHRAFVTNTNSSTVSVIDTQSDSVVAVLPHDMRTGIGAGPVGIAVDAVGRQAYVPTDDQLTVVDVDSLRVTKVIPRGGNYEYGLGVQGISVDAEHRLAYLVSSKWNTLTVAQLDATAGVSRRGGADRFEVSAANSSADFNPGVEVAYVASGSAFADALSGSAAAGARRSPVLLVATNSIPTIVGAELARLKPKRIVVLGGTASVSAFVERALRAYSPAVDRVGGTDRYTVSAAVSGWLRARRCCRIHSLRRSLPRRAVGLGNRHERRRPDTFGHEGQHPRGHQRRDLAPESGTNRHSRRARHRLGGGRDSTRSSPPHQSHHRRRSLRRLRCGVCRRFPLRLRDRVHRLGSRLSRRTLRLAGRGDQRRTRPARGPERHPGSRRYGTQPTRSIANRRAWRSRDRF